jgi:hypothetical protein
VRAVALLLVASAAGFAALTVWTNHTTAATHEHSHEFVRNAKQICEGAPHTAAGVRAAANAIAKLRRPPNLERAVARLTLHWSRIVALQPGTKRYRSEVEQVRLSAHLLNVTACRSVAPH